MYLSTYTHRLRQRCVLYQTWRLTVRSLPRLVKIHFRGAFTRDSGVASRIRCAYPTYAHTLESRYPTNQNTSPRRGKCTHHVIRDEAHTLEYRELLVQLLITVAVARSKYCRTHAHTHTHTHTHIQPAHKSQVLLRVPDTVFS